MEPVSIQWKSERSSSPVIDKGLTAYYAVGVSERMDIGLNVPIQQTAVRTGHPTERCCPDLSLQGASANSRILIGAGRRRFAFYRVGDHLFRVGSYHAETRDRLTNIGEGSIDFGAGLLFGRVLLAGAGDPLD